MYQSISSQYLEREGVCQWVSQQHFFINFMQVFLSKITKCLNFLYAHDTCWFSYSLPVGWVCRLACNDGNAEAFRMSGGTLGGLRLPTGALLPCRLLGGTYTPPGLLSMAAAGSDNSVTWNGNGKIYYEICWVGEGRLYLQALFITIHKFICKIYQVLKPIHTCTGFARSDAALDDSPTVLEVIVAALECYIAAPTNSSIEHLHVHASYISR